MSAWRRVVATLGVAVLVATGCGLLGLWQWHRHETRSAAVAVVLANYDAQPVALADLLGADGAVAAGSVWHPATVSGRYLPGSTVLLRNRPVDGRRGFHVLEAFEVGTGPLAGRGVGGDRGWLDGGADAATVPAVPRAPAGEVELTGRLRAAERPATGAAPPGQVRAIAPDQVLGAAAEPWSGQPLPAYLQAVTEQGVRPAGLGGLEPPSTDLGSNLSYAFQWWVFAAGSLVRAVVLLRRDGTLAVPQVRPLGARAGPAPGRPPTARRRGRAEEEEDALLDAYEAQLRAKNAGQAGASPSSSADGT